MSPKLTDHQFLIFDVYGTLVDWESGLYNALRPLLAGFPKAAKWSKDEAIHAFLSVESDIQAQHPSMLYSDLLANAHEVLEARLQAAEERFPDDKLPEGATTLEGRANNTSIVSSTSKIDSDASGEASTSETPLSSPTQNSHMAFGNSVKKWNPFPDSSQALHDLSKHFHLIVLSNVDHASFAYSHYYLSEGALPSLTQAQPSAPTPYSRPSPNPHPRDLWLPRQTPNSTSSKSPFSMILTAQDTGAYKPSLSGFLTAFEAIQSEPSLLRSPSSPDNTTINSGTNAEDFHRHPSVDEIKSKTLIVAQSLTHDHEPAKQLGVSSVWIDRQSATLRPAPPSDGSEFGWKWRFETLGDLAKAVEREKAER